MICVRFQTNSPKSYFNVESAAAVSSKLSSLVRMANSDARDEDEGSNKGVSPSKYVKSQVLQPYQNLWNCLRDRSQPLSQINSLMTTANAEKGSQSGLSPRGSPINHEIPTKLLAALGTTASPVNLLLTPTWLPLPFLVVGNHQQPCILSMTNSNKKEDDKSLKKVMLSLINRVGQHKHAFMFSKSILTDDLIAQGYAQKIKRPLDIPTIKRNIETGVIKSFGQLERDITLMLMNLVMFNHVTGIPPAKVFGMNAEMSADCMAMFEKFRVSLKLPKLIPEVSKREECDEEPESEPLEEVKSKDVTLSKSVGSKRRNRSISLSGNTEETPETKRRTLRTSTATATSAWHTRKKIPTSSPDIASLSDRGRAE